LEKQLKEEAETMLKYCQESIPTCDPPELGHMLIFVEHIKALNEMLMKCREDSFEANDNDEPEIAEVKRKERVRHQQTEQTILMIQDRLLQVPEEVSDLLFGGIKKRGHIRHTDVFILKTKIRAMLSHFQPKQLSIRP
jgi:hypothetical protein